MAMIIFYRPSICVMVTLFTEKFSVFFSSEVDLDTVLPKKNAGRFGEANNIVSLISIEITSDINGLSNAFSCTQRSAT